MRESWPDRRLPPPLDNGWPRPLVSGGANGLTGRRYPESVSRVVVTKIDCSRHTSSPSHASIGRDTRLASTVLDCVAPDQNWFGSGGTAMRRSATTTALLVAVLGAG